MKRIDENRKEVNLITQWVLTFLSRETGFGLGSEYGFA